MEGAVVVGRSAALAVVVLCLCLSQLAASGNTAVWVPTPGAGTCRGTIAECDLVKEEGLAMDSEANRRTLQQVGGGGFISTMALMKGSIPCKLAGASYANCRPGQPVSKPTPGAYRPQGKRGV